MFKEALTSLQASTATSDASVCRSGAAWLRSSHCSKRNGAVFSSLTVFLQSLLKSVFTIWSYYLCVANAWIFHKKLNAIFPTSSWLQMAIKFSVDPLGCFSPCYQSSWDPLAAFAFPFLNFVVVPFKPPKDCLWNCPIIIFICLLSLNFSPAVFLSSGAIFCFIFRQPWFCLANAVGTVGAWQGFCRERGPLQMGCGQAAVARGISSTHVPKTSTQTEGLARQSQVFLVKRGMLCVTAHVLGWFYTQVLWEQWNFQIASPVSWLKLFQQRNSSFKVILHHR